jgi:hypothetical protein
MSFFELDGGAKKKARKSTKPKAKTTKTKKTPTKKSTSGKKKTKKGGNFLGTVSELFAPAGWENFVTAAGLLALDRTDNYLRKNKDSKKQRGGADDATTPSKADHTPKTEEMESFTSRMSGGARKKKNSSRKHHGGEDTMMAEEEMMGGTRKKNSSRKQRGGSDGHHTVEALDAMMGSEVSSEDNQMSSQTGGAKKRSKGTGRKHRGGEFMTPEQKQSFLNIYDSQNYKTNNNQSINSSRRIQAILEAVGVSINPNTIGEMDSAISEARQLIKNRNFNQSLKQQANAQSANAQPVANTQSVANNTASSFGFGGKPKPKSKSSSKKPKAKKPKTKAPKKK